VVGARNTLLSDLVADRRGVGACSRIASSALDALALRVTGRSRWINRLTLGGYTAPRGRVRNPVGGGTRGGLEAIVAQCRSNGAARIGLGCDAPGVLVGAGGYTTAAEGAVGMLLLAPLVPTKRTNSMGAVVGIRCQARHRRRQQEERREAGET